MKSKLSIQLTAFIVLTTLSACVSGGRVAGLSSASKVGSHVISIEGPSSMSGPSGQGALVDALASAIVDQAADSDPRRQREAAMAAAIRAAMEDELSRQSAFHYQPQHTLHGVQNEARLYKLKFEETGRFVLANGLAYALRFSVRRSRVLVGLKEAPMLVLQATMVDSAGKIAGDYSLILKGAGQSGTWLKGLDPRDPVLLPQWEALARQAVRDMISKMRGGH